MESVRQLPSGKWQGRFTGPDGKRYTAGTHDSRRKAQKAVALKLAEVTEKKNRQKASTETRFDTFAETWLYSRRPGEPDGYSPGGYYRQQKQLAILAKTFGDQHIEDITPAQVRTWWNGYSHAPCARRDIYGLVQQIMSVALDDELISRSPCRIKGASKAMSKPRPTFTETDITTLYFATENPQDRALLTILSGTAMRIGEAVALDWEDISFFDRKANVERHLTPWGMRSGTKTGEDESRVLALPSWLTDELETLYRASDGTGPIFRTWGSLVRRQRRADASQAPRESESLHDAPARHPPRQPDGLRSTARSHAEGHHGARRSQVNQGRDGLPAHGHPGG
jgi:integrase